MQIGGSAASDHEKRFKAWKQKRADEAAGIDPKKKRKRRKPKDTKTKIPADHPLAYLFDWFRDIRYATGNSGFGHVPIPHTEILAYRELHQLDMDTFDVDTLRRLDWLWLKCRPEKPDPKGDGGRQ